MQTSSAAVHPSCAVSHSSLPMTLSSNNLLLPLLHVIILASSLHNVIHTHSPPSLWVQISRTHQQITLVVHRFSQRVTLQEMGYHNTRTVADRIAVRTQTVFLIQTASLNLSHPINSIQPLLSLLPQTILITITTQLLFQIFLLPLLITHSLYHPHKKPLLHSDSKNRTVRMFLLLHQHPNTSSKQTKILTCVR